jgi:hypothetical protein
MDKKSLDAETKIRLLISFIGDEGREKLNNNIEKLLLRLGEYVESYRSAIVEYFVKA